MGMSNMQVQQSTQPSGGKGIGGGIPNQQTGTPAYFTQNQDVADSYAQNNYGMTPDQFAQTHFENYGQTEQRAAPGQQPQTGQPAGKGAKTTMTATSRQPQMGQPNMYPNTVGQWDNASIQSQQPLNRGGKGKG